MPMLDAVVNGNNVRARIGTCVLYHRLATGTTALILHFFSPVSKPQNTMIVSNLDNVGRIGDDRNFVLIGVALDPVGVAAANSADLLEFQHGEAVLRRNSDIVMRSAVRAIGSMGGPGLGFVDAGSLGTVSNLDFDGGPLILHEPELFKAGDRIDLAVSMAAAMTNDRNILASLIGFEVVTI